MSQVPASTVFAGLFATQRELPTWLLYDDIGCALYDQITTLPEYYLTRAESEVLRRYADAILDLAAPAGEPVALA